MKLSFINFSIILATASHQVQGRITNNNRVGAEKDSGDNQRHLIDEYGVQDYEEIIETVFDEGLDFEEEYYEGEMDSDVKAFEDGDLMEYSDVNFDNQELDGMVDFESEEKALTEMEIENLFIEDLESGHIDEMMVHPDQDDFDGEEMFTNYEDENNKLRGRSRKLQTSSLTLLCRHSNCQGGHVWLRPGRYPSMPWQIGNDALSRVYIPAGTTFTYYEHTWYRGWTRTFGEPNRRVNLYMGGHNDAVSSFIIRQF
eukprot:CAMPEP_0178914766 /NCGR_PEP_ID=MMETSP0786-20121207/11623_1 /TAXON_ID=186022 /ORGANISM="Thalassionema frauenfeldii, Strain CCMP 1798" /LENGTH=255 /DNA_ID=CAMNT_0020587741 /DNA_START=52 /DNA_END=819 /DNA_ORIENTATION=-